MTAVAPAISLVALLCYVTLDSSHHGLEATYWHRIRQRWLPSLDRIARRFGLGYAVYELNAKEYAGRIDQPVETVETMLAAEGFERMPLAAWKTLADGRSEAGSWAFRERLLADRQLHVILFRADDGTTELYAHEEYNPFHPARATDHYHCVGHDPEAGTQRVADILANQLETPSKDQPADGEDSRTPPETTRIGTAVEPPSARNQDSGATAD